ncbi:MAG: hypothetical protein M3066_07990 [Actinomycetota bacterium]|nr:hypothetical protein [Actinomycetota bacterium]
MQKKIRRSAGGMNIVADLNAVVATGTTRTRGGAGTTSRQSVRIVQTDGRTEVSSTEEG